MDTDVFDLYELSSEKERRLWEDCIFIFDSSALLDFYQIPKEAREIIYSDVFEKLNDRLWIPYHVQYEYMKNRQRVIKEPISKKYIPLQKKINDLLNIVKKDLLGKAKEIKNDTKKNNTHPNLKQEEIELFIEKIHTFSDTTNSFNEKILKEVKVKTTEISNIEQNDDVVKSLKKYFSIGKEFSFEEILKITKEGKHRYEFDIPPGYGDSRGKNRKKGTQIFGDLIIWKQILNYSIKAKKPIIFITNDITKDDDWCYQYKGNITAPREELVKEIKDYSGVEFWMYSLSQYLYKANKFIKSDINNKVIENISDHIAKREVKLTKNILNDIYGFNLIKSSKIESLISCELELFIKEKYNNIEIIQPKFQLDGDDVNTVNMILIVEENILIEVNVTDSILSVSSETDYLLSILMSYNIKEAIQYFPNIKSKSKFKFGSIEKIIEHKHFHVYQVFGG